METEVMIVEDDGLFRDLLRSSLSQHPSFNVVGCAPNGAEAVRMAQQQHVGVALMDIELGDDVNGIEVGRLIRMESPSTGIVLLSSHSNKEYLNAIPLDEAQGWSYLTKQSVSDLNVLTRAIEGAAVGLNVVDPVLVRSLRPGASTVLESLSPRQLEIL